jgi:twitching motility protein PilT
MKWSGLLELLAVDNGYDEFVLAPHAPALARGGQGEGWQLVASEVLRASDVEEVIELCVRHAARLESADLGEAGSFSFGIEHMGRFRLTYITQRGSRSVTIVRIPIGSRALAEICPDAVFADRLVHHLSGGACGVLLYSSDRVRVNRLAYALVSAINASQRRLIFVLERSLSCLLSHGNSVVLQAEVGADVPSYEDGLRAAFVLQPDVAVICDMDWDVPLRFVSRLYASVPQFLMTTSFWDDEMMKRALGAGQSLFRKTGSESRGPLLLHLEWDGDGVIRHDELTLA